MIGMRAGRPDEPIAIRHAASGPTSLPRQNQTRQAEQTGWRRRDTRPGCRAKVRGLIDAVRCDRDGYSTLHRMVGWSSVDSTRSPVARDSAGRTRRSAEIGGARIPLRGTVPWVFPADEGRACLRVPSPSPASGCLHLRRLRTLARPATAIPHRENSPAGDPAKHLLRRLDSRTDGTVSRRRQALGP